jgi:hypothetical protein
MQGVEVGNTIDPEDDGLAIDNELLLPVLQRGLDNPREIVCSNRGRCG